MEITTGLLVDYVAATPGITPDMRGAGFEATLTHDDLELIEDHTEKYAEALYLGTSGYVGVFQQDAYSKNQDDLRDELVHRMGQLAGFDVDGALTSGERQDEPIALTPHDKRQLGINNPDLEEVVPSTVRGVRFGFVPTKKEVLIIEVEQPTYIVMPEGNKVDEKYVRVLSLHVIPDRTNT